MKKIPMQLQIRLLGNPILRYESELIDPHGDMGFPRKMGKRLLASMKMNSGYGVAAPQLGYPLRMFSTDRNGGTVMVNPELVDSDGSVVMNEGCLSVPGLFFDIERPKSIAVKYYDLDWNEYLFQADGLEARILLHELDHLSGILVVDKISPEERSRALRQLGIQGEV